MYAHLELTKREWEILNLLGRTGMTHRELADALYISPATVNTHLTRIYSKLEVENSQQAIVYAWQTGIVERNQ